VGTPDGIEGAVRIRQRREVTGPSHDGAPEVCSPSLHGHNVIRRQIDRGETPRWANQLSYQGKEAPASTPCIENMPAHFESNGAQHRFIRFTAGLEVDIEKRGRRRGSIPPELVQQSSARTPS